MKKVTCIICPRSCQIEVFQEDHHFEVRGNGCKRGVDFALREAVNPQRTLTTTVRTAFEEYPLLPVRTDRDIPLDCLQAAMAEINKLTLDHSVALGEVLIENLLNTGANLISTSAFSHSKSLNNY